MIIEYFITLGIFVGFDLVWLKFITKKFYREQIGYLLTKKPNRFAGLAFYLIFVVGLLVFVINPSVSWHQALVLGLLFGLVTYSTYDLTNLATVKKWPLKVTIIDLIWGLFIGSAVSSISYLLIQLF